MNDPQFIALFIPLIIALVGMAAPIIKTLIEKRKPEAEALKIYKEIQASDAEAAQKTIEALRADVARLRDICHRYGINPDTGTGPLAQIKVKS